MTATPEERRDETIAAIEEVGGVILSTPVPMATSTDPHMVVAYRIEAGAPDLETSLLLKEVRRDSESFTENLVEWTPAPQPPIEYEEYTEDSEAVDEGSDTEEV